MHRTFNRWSFALLACLAACGPGNPAENDPPVATAASLAMDEDTVLNGTLAGTGPEGATLTFAVVNAPTRGTVSVSPSGAFTYTPAANAHGADTFTFKVNDGNADSAAATVNVTIRPINDAPSVVSVSIGDGPYRTDDTIVATPAGWSDVDGDAEGYTFAWYVNGTLVNGVTGQALSGTFFAKGNRVHVVVTPADGTTSGAAVTSNAVVIQNSSATISRGGLGTFEGVAATGTLPVVDPDGEPLTYAISSQPANGTVALTGPTTGQYTFTPSPGFEGRTRFTFTAAEGASTPVEGTIDVLVTGVAALSIGDRYGCAIGPDSKLRCFGANDSGQRGDGTRLESNVPVVEASGHAGWVRVSTGGEVAAMGPRGELTAHTCAIRSDGALFCWGRDDKGQVGNGATQGDVLEPVRIGTSEWVDVATGFTHTCGIQRDLSLWCWGDSHWGQGGIAGTTLEEPRRVGTQTGWTSVAAGNEHSCATRIDGTLWCWGLNDARQLGIGNQLSTATPTQELLAATTWTKVVAARDTTAALRGDGSFWSWGANHDGQAGQGTDGSDFITSPARVGSASDWAVIDLAPDSGCGVKTTGQLLCWGHNRRGSIGQPLTTTKLFTPTQVGTDTDWVDVSTGSFGGCARKSGGTTHCWGDNTVGQTATGTDQSNLVPAQVGSGTDWRDVGVRSDSRSPYVEPLGPGTCASKTDGTLWCTGEGFVVGNGTQPAQSVFTQPTPTVSTWASFSTGGQHTCATRTNGTLWCWGAAESAQLGAYPFRTREANPVQVGSATDWAEEPKDVAAGEAFTCALRTTGALYCWGDNRFGQVGVNSTSPMSISPTRVGNTALYLSVAAGANHVCAIRADGTLWCWGLNEHAQLGVNPTNLNNFPESCIVGRSRACSRTPRQIGTATHWAKVVAGGGHTCALTSAGAVSCWGRNNAGQVGSGQLGPETCDPGISTACSVTPSVLGDGFADLYAGANHTCALRTTGELWCWGKNNAGQMGDGTQNDRLAPYEVDSGSTGWLDVAVGGELTCAIRDLEGRRPLWCWGRSENGAFGDGYNWYTQPVPTLLP